MCEDRIKIWDVERGQVLRTLKGHTSGVTGVAFSPDGRRLASASGDATIKVWDLESDVDACTIKEENSDANTVAYSRDGRWLASSKLSDGKITLWDAVSGTKMRVFDGHKQSVRSLGFMADGRRLASLSTDGTIRFWDVHSGRELQKLEYATTNDFGIHITDTAISQDSQRIAFSLSDGLVHLWDLESGREILNLKASQSRSVNLALDANGKVLAVASSEFAYSDKIKLFDTKAGNEIRSLDGSSRGVRKVTFSNDGRWLASISADEIKLADVKTGAEVGKFRGHKGGVQSLAFSPDGRRIASAGSEDGTLKIWDVGADKELLTLKGSKYIVWEVAFSPDGQQLAVANEHGGVTQWDATLRTEDEKMARFLVKPLSEATPDPIELANAIRAQVNWTESMRIAALAYIEHLPTVNNGP